MNPTVVVVLVFLVFLLLLPVLLVVITIGISLISANEEERRSSRERTQEEEEEEWAGMRQGLRCSVAQRVRMRSETPPFGPTMTGTAQLGIEIRDSGGTERIDR